MKWILFAFVPPMCAAFTHTELSPKASELCGGFILFCIVCFFVELETVDTKALEKAAEKLTQGGYEYEEGHAMSVVMFCVIAVIAVMVLISQGAILKNPEGLCAMAAVFTACFFGSWLAPEPSEDEVERKYQKLLYEAVKNMENGEG